MCCSDSPSYLFLSNFSFRVFRDVQCSFLIFFVPQSNALLGSSDSYGERYSDVYKREARVSTRVILRLWKDEIKHWVSNSSPKNNFSTIRTWDQRRTSLLGPPRRPPPLRWRPRFSPRLLLPLNPYKLLSIPCFREVSLGLRLKIVSCKIIASN